jgi:hydrogenase maturation protease
VRAVELLLCGEAARGDDAVATAIVDALPSATAAMVRVRQVGQLMPDDLLTDGSPVIVIDAVDGPPAGEVIDLDLRAVAELTPDFVPSSCHALPLPLVVGIAARLRTPPLEGRFVGVAGGSWDIGAGLSSAVADSVPHAADRVAHWVRQLSATSPRAEQCA